MKNRADLKAALKRAKRKQTRKNRKYVPYRSESQTQDPYAEKNSPDSLMLQL